MSRALSRDDDYVHGGCDQRNRDGILTRPRQLGFRCCYDGVLCE
jgi:hypothetical protein